MSTNTAVENIAISVDNTINLEDRTTGVKRYLTTLNVINKSNNDIATPTFVSVATSRTNNTFFHGAKDKSGKASNPAGIIIEQGHQNSAGNIVIDPKANKLAAVNFAISSIVPRAGDKITAVSNKAWQSATLAKGASQKVQLGFMIPKANSTFRFTMLFAVMDGSKAPEATKVCEGDFVIDGVDTAGDLEKIKNCKVITGDLKIERTDLKNLNRLKNLTVVVGFLDVEQNNNLTNLEGLNNITEIGGILSVFSNRNLVNLKGLNPSLTSVGGLSIAANGSLKNLEGLNKITAVGSLRVFWNDVIESLEGVNNLTTVESDLSVFGNNKLSNIESLRNVKSANIGGYIYDNPELDCTPYNKNPFAFFPLTRSTGNKVNCTTQ